MNNEPPSDSISTCAFDPNSGLMITRTPFTSTSSCDETESLQEITEESDRSHSDTCSFEDSQSPDARLRYLNERLSHDHLDMEDQLLRASRVRFEDHAAWVTESGNRTRLQVREAGVTKRILLEEALASEYAHLCSSHANSLVDTENRKTFATRVRNYRNLIIQLTKVHGQNASHIVRVLSANRLWNHDHARLEQLTEDDLSQPSRYNRKLALITRLAGEGKLFA